MDSASQPVLIVRELVHSQKIQIPKSHHKAIIGNHGETLEDLEKLIGVSISVPSTKARSEMIEIKGTRESIRKAVEKIRAISLEQAKIVTERVSIPKKYHPFINFKSCIKTSENNEEKEDKVQSVYIKVPSHYIIKDEVVLTGMTEEVAKVSERILAQYEAILQLNHQELTMKVDKEEHKFVIGQRRSHIDEVFSSTGVSVQVPLAESPSEVITLLGPAESLQKAAKIVKEKLEIGRTNHRDTILVTNKHLQHISSKRSAIQEIQASLGVKVLLPDPADLNFTKFINIVGTKEAIIAAKKQIISIMDNITISAHIDISPEHQSFLIKNKRTLQKIRRDFPNISVRFPKVEEQSSQVILSGSPAQVDKVKEILMEAADDLINKSDNKNEQPIRNGKIKSFDFRDKRSDPSTRKDRNNNTRIITPSKNKEKKVPVKQTYNVRINPYVYSRIIGLLGRAVRKIERDHKVHVQFPKPTDPIPDDVLITGMDRKSIEGARAVLVELERRYLNEDSASKGEKNEVEVSVTKGENESNEKEIEACSN